MKRLPIDCQITLLEIGKALRSGNEFPSVEHLRCYDAINRQLPEYWKDTGAELAEDELVNLVYGLTFVERCFGWLGGSASGVVWLFSALVGRGADVHLLDEVSSWVLDHTNNPYAPFGTRVSLGARNYSEYVRLSRSRADAISSCIERDAELDARAAAERLRRREMAAVGARDRSNGVRRRIIESLESFSIQEKLERIAIHPVYPPQFFPTSIADAATQEVVDALPESVRVELARRLKGRRRGPWGNFRKRLLKSVGQKWDKKAWRL